MRVLVVEGEAPVASAIGGTLRKAGHGVMGPVRTAAEALRLAEEDRPDLAFVATGLRDGPASGIDLARTLAVRLGVRSVLVGGRVEDAREGCDAAMGFIAEPGDPGTLLGAVEAAHALAEGRRPIGIPAGLELFARPGPPQEPGCDANHPGDIPGAGWWAVARRVWGTTTEKGLWVAAGGVAFFTFFALIPALGIVVQTYGLFVGHDAIASKVGELGGVLPDKAMNALVGQLMGTAADAGQGFGWGLAGSLLLLLWSAVFAMRALIAALNHAYRETEKRGTFVLNGLALLLGACGLGLSIGSVALLTADPALVGPALEPAWASVLRIARWPFVAVLVAAMLALCYRIGPCRTAPKWRWLSWGAAAGAGLWVLASLGFSVYVRRIAQYEVAYGLAGAVLVLMIWLYLLSYAVLLGAALNAELERQTARDTTVGAERPPGTRGASAADRAKA